MQNLPFPTVTFCNFNAIKKESLYLAMDQYSEMDTFIKQLLEHGMYNKKSIKWDFFIIHRNIKGNDLSFHILSWH